MKPCLHPVRMLAFLLFTRQCCAQTQVPGEPPPVEIPRVEKRVVIDKTTQMLRAYEDGNLVIESKVSTGKMGRRTPSGNFTAEEKHRMHRSRLYHSAPMPWSVQVNGNIFIHGFTSVPDHPASHGCVRVPINGDNAAKRFFAWVDIGTPIEISGEWAGKLRSPDKVPAREKSGMAPRN